jgi:hypothetical protein
VKPLRRVSRREKGGRREEGREEREERERGRRGRGGRREGR